METGLLFRHNVISLNSIDSFVNIRGGFNKNFKDVYFVRIIGESNEIGKTIEQLDRTLENEMKNNRLKYLRISILPRMRDISDSDFYASSYDKWMNGSGIALKNISMQEFFAVTLDKAVKTIIQQYTYSRNSISDTIVRNFTIKLLFWLDSIGGNLFSQWTERTCIKVIADNVVREQEYLFYQMLTLLGCDVMLIQNRADIDLTKLCESFSCAIEVGEFGHSEIQKYTQADSKKSKCKSENTTESDSVIKEKNLCPKVIIPERQRKKTSPTSNLVSTGVKNESGVETKVKRGNVEKTFEELAQLASSVVLIAIHNREGDIIGTGSGIMIGKNGFILTNNHVASGGRFYSIRIEDDDEVYTTDEVIKYNSVTDLAVIRINKELKPIPIYKGKKKLARGQKVVAIGSPLGLFNSVSDGIISGFRNIDDVDMIQFTAPISHGSSGGAVLNMQGEVIGISTAGIDSGQNINLAIGYENILMFAKGFY